MLIGCLARGSTGLEGWHLHLRAALQGFTMGAAPVDASYIVIIVSSWCALPDLSVLFGPPLQHAAC